MTVHNRPAELAVALDFQTGREALTLAAKLRGVVPWAKVGLELFTAEGPPVIAGLKELGFKVFLDLKFYDIPNTVRGAVRSAAALGADMTTLHHAGGERMAQAALQGLAESGSNMFIFAITILTSTTPAEAGLADAAAVTGAVAAKAAQAKAWGLPGIVCSGHEAAAVKAAAGRDFLCLCPGIRLAGEAGGAAPASSDDQRRVMTPGQAVAAGADFLVMGRPITRADDPALAAKAALADMRGS